VAREFDGINLTFGGFFFLELTTIDLFFLLSFVIWIVLGYALFRKFYTSIEELLATTEIKKSRAMQYRAEHVVNTMKNSVFFSIILSLGINFFALQIYSYFFNDVPVFSYNFFLFSIMIILIGYPLGEVVYFTEKENEAETPYHKVIRKIARKLVGKLKGQGETAFVFALIFYLIPITILYFGLEFNFYFSVFLVFIISPLAIITYMIAYGIFRLLTSFLYLHNLKNIKFYIGLVYLGILVLFEISLIRQDKNLILFALSAFLLVLIYCIIKELKYRPSELSHIIDDVTRPIEWVNGAFLILVYGIFGFLGLNNFSNPEIPFIFIPASTAPLIQNILIIQSFLIPLFLLLIIISKTKYPSRALVVALSKDSMKLNAAIKSQFINDQTLIDSIEKSINKGYIRPEYTPKLSRLIKSEDTHTRRKAIILFRKITENDRFKSVSIVPNLLNFLKLDKVWTVRLEAAESLASMMQILPKIEVKDIFDFLSKLELDKNRYVRWGIIKVFNSIVLAREDKLPDILPYFYKGLEDEEWSVRKGTIESFNQLINRFPNISQEILGKSLPLLKDEDLDVIKELFQLISTITGMEVKEENLQALESAITEKLESSYPFNSNLLEASMRKLKEATKAPKFVFKKSDLEKK